MTVAELSALLDVLAGIFPNAGFSVPVFGSEVKLTLAELKNILAGQAQTIGLQPFDYPVLDKKLQIACVENGISVSVV